MKYQELNFRFFISVVTIILFSLTIGVCQQSNVTTHTIQIVNKTDESAIYGAHLQIYQGFENDVVVINGITNASGRFLLDMPDSIKSCYADVYALGYKRLIKYHVTLSDTLHLIYLENISYELSTVEIVGEQDSILLKGDTISYNTELIKSNTDVALNDLILKIPGAELVDGEIVMNDQKVSSVNIDGNKYSNSGKSALQNIPADIIYRIEVIDVISPENPTNVSQIINVVTKNPEVTHFGKIAANFGTSNRFRVGGNYFYKNNKFKITALGDVNNINKEDLLSENLKSLYEGDNALLGTGIFLKYTHNEKLNIDFDAVFNKVDRLNQLQYLQENTVKINSIFNSIKTSENNEIMSDLNFQVNKKIKNNSFLNFSSNYFLSNDSTRIILNDQFVDNDIISFQLYSEEYNRRKLENINNRVNFSYNFGDNKQSSISGAVGYLRQQTSEIRGIAYQYDSQTDDITIGNDNYINNDFFDFQTSLKSTKDNWTFLFNMYGQFAVKSQVSLAEAYRLGNYNEEWSEGLSSEFENSYLLTKLKTGLTRKIGKWSIGANATVVDFSMTNLTELKTIKYQNERQLILPELFFSKRLNAFKNYSLSYSVEESIPEFNRMSTYIDNSAPSRIIQGNPTLKLGINHNVALSINSYGKSTIRSSVKYNVKYVQNYIGNKILIPIKDTVIQNVSIPANNQYYGFENFSLATFHSLRLKHEKIRPKHNYYIKYGPNYEIIPGSINGEVFSNKLIKFYAKISENYSPNKLLNINVAASSNITRINTSLADNITTDLLNWNVNTSVKYLMFHRILCHLESVTFQVKNLTSQANNSIINTINGNVKLGLFKNQKASLQFFVFDIFNQNADITYASFNNFVITENRLMLRRYFLIGLAMNL